MTEADDEQEKEVKLFLRHIVPTPYFNSMSLLLFSSPREVRSSKSKARGGPDPTLLSTFSDPSIPPVSRPGDLPRCSGGTLIVGMTTCRCLNVTGCRFVCLRVGQWSVIGQAGTLRSRGRTWRSHWSTPVGRRWTLEFAATSSRPLSQGTRSNSRLNPCHLSALRAPAPSSSSAQGLVRL